MLSEASPRLQKTLHGKLSTFLFNILCQHLASVNQLVKCLEKTGKYNFMDVGNMYLCEYIHIKHTFFYIKYTHLSI